MAKKYSLEIENEQITAVSVKGVQYPNPAAVRDPRERAHLERLVEESGLPLAHPPPDPLRFLVPLFLGIALILLAVAVTAGVSASRALAREQVIRGHIVQLMVYSDSDGGQIAYPVVEYTLPGQAAVTVELSTGRWPPGYRAGQLVTLRLDPARPENIRIAGGGPDLEPWVLTLITGFLALAFLTAAFFARWLLRETKDLPVPVGNLDEDDEDEPPGATS